ncbi:MAG: SDR family NAD(P)-dependent oxidoreductase [Deltaproteobacteria bacterium]|nr:SDR family NAD(P)-dependent oxidoreductase [Deltaproteobacteria bacterium]
MRRNSPTHGSIPVKLALAGVAAAGCAYAVRRHRRIDFSGRTVLISGASRGLGLELARGFAAEHANIILLARNQERLDESRRELEDYGIRVSIRQCDVTHAEEVRHAVASVIGDFGPIDILVNNAGTIQVGPIDNMQLQDYDEAMAVHFWGPLHLMQEVIPHMKQQRGGRIVNITSIGGKVAVPHLTPYVASKFALVGLSEGMRAELVKDAIYVTTVVPGLMRTGSHVNAFFKGKHKKEYALFSMANASPLLSTSSQRAARQIIEACRYGKAELVITPQARLLQIASSLFPSITAEIMGVVSRALPGKQPGAGDELKRGWQSQSLLAPSLLTRMADRMVRRNNEEPQAPRDGKNNSTFREM